MHQIGTAAPAAIHSDTQIVARVRRGDVQAYGALVLRYERMMLAAVLPAATLRALLASPDQPDGPAVIEYRKPRAGKDRSAEVIVFENPDFRRNGNVAAAMGDGHAEVLSAEQFEKQMK